MTRETPSQNLGYFPLTPNVINISLEDKTEGFNSR